MSDEKVALVTGATRGLGKETARQLARLGYRVLIGSRTLADGREVAAEIGDRAEAVELDVATEDHLLALRKRIESIGRLDALVNNAGIVGEASYSTSVLDFELSDLRQVLEINLLGAIRASSAVVPMMRKRGSGTVVNVSSGMGQLSDMTKGSPSYRFSKAALNAFTRILSQELIDTKIKVNSVCPGWVRTDLGGPNAKLSVEEGARGIVWAATLDDDGPSGGFFRHKKPIDW
jgi:NAD(P)-dependent dehydrogenase (short-subunit alcohol dehydrogenase family)